MTARTLTAAALVAAIFMRGVGQVSAEKELHPCCACCEDVAKDDHVEHGGAVERNGHILPCLTCGGEVATS